ncbi:precorrin-2 C(20)-methyltransferase [Glycomyces sp. TRM65418]|uniref:precorrin-2 C(20)-methyltransferase n=1 Tax=Glycomyces sp. TRM65418 TaxID=2867006 RepID=UPI001CE4C381|nr:precorrin-2 C(20)-methyltransferase [Glycomyces sp. TRM65418]MCC3764547.1 precorrin-2 C(20)-methyltransferase [Glycomyces sp. TRM65418]QZD54214.1 precorrin-2 C(20)-methyltransferase [Glycomyces sp. TRM65418]
MSGTLIGIGTGPGDPDLITVKGRDSLLRADRVFVPVAASSSADEPGYAERVVAHHVPHDKPIHRLVFELGKDRREIAWARAADKVADVVAAGGTAAFATIGDPNVYSTFTYLAREVRRLVPDAAVRTVPGITAMQDLASRTGTVLVEHDEPLHLMPITAGTDRIRAALAGGGTVVLYKGGRKLPEIRAVLEEAGALDRAVFGAHLGHAGEQVRADLPDTPAPYLSTVIVAPEREDRV